MPATILAVATAVPARLVDAAEARGLMAAIWPQAARLAGRSSEAPKARHIAADVERILQDRGLSERMDDYRRHAVELATEAASKALDRAGLTGADIDLVVSVSCTGYLVPSLDALLQDALGFRPDCLRLPITELGCAAGAAALAQAMRHLVAYPTDRVLVIAVELPSVTFQPGDRSIDNLTASSIFGDAAAAAVLCGAALPGRLSIVDAATHLVPGTLSALGYDLRDGGFHVVLDRRLPRIVGGVLSDVFRSFLLRTGSAEVEFAAVHGGGPRIMDAVEQALDLPGDLLAPSREVYDSFGNTSSVSILMVLEALGRTLGPDPLRGVGIAIGPGLSIELLRLAWTPGGSER